MTGYTELVKALRCKRDDCKGCGLAFFDKDEGWMCQYAAKDDDAADAIEALQAQLPKRGDSREEKTVVACLSPNARNAVILSRIATMMAAIARNYPAISAIICFAELAEERSEHERTD